ncbi:TaqI-like C-terminal specificity domain-containing protein [Desulfobacterales bacterium HSG2]|nr:TaqI-like C-terminal specificity domain-containing protein [Desulfobacterales bacterium HSG2]
MKQKIQNAIRNFGQDDLFDAAIRLFQTLGYDTERQNRLDHPTYQEFSESYLEEENDRIPDIGKFGQKALTAEWKGVELLFQLTESEMTDQGMLFDTKKVDNTIFEAYLLFAIELKGTAYSRTKLSDITRQMNRVFSIPVMILFRYGGYLTLSVIKRRLHKRDESRDVLEKVTLIKDIRIADPHRAHIEILADLGLDSLRKTYTVTNFVALHNAWQKVLDCSELNKKFYRELADWYFWALKHAVFPSQNDMSEETRNPVNVIRLITRLIFVWFIREKGLIPEDIFDEPKLGKLLRDFSPESGTYYRAILQNLFFATLNTPMKSREFRTEKRYQDKNKSYMMHNCYRYRSCFRTPNKILKLLEKTPFLNGGLFECLDSEKPVTRIDGFSDRKDNRLHLPNFLFFSESRSEDLNRDYGTRNRKYQVRGLIDLLKRYKFTVAENTPVEEEIALDPELLGRAFENLLASYNPETGTTARKQTGSFYTPREIVSYMADESLIAYLENRLTDFYEGRAGFVLRKGASRGRLFGTQKPVRAEIAPSPKRLSDAEKKEINGKLRHLLSYTEEDHRFIEEETEALIAALHQLKILDPACGSGAFPMGILHKMLHILRKTDPVNARWKEWQIENETRKINQDIETAERINDDRARDKAVRELNERLENIDEIFGNNELDYARKLYLIQNCIFGVDIQSVAVQIAKLRFFISLVVDQKTDEEKENIGILPLPNLETRFIAANTLIGIEESGQTGLKDTKLFSMEDDLKTVRERYFNARTRDTKKRCMAEDKRLRKEISRQLAKKGFSTDTTKKLAKWDLYDQNASAEFFDPEWMFGIRDGFDIVIGNPPYVRHEKIKHLKPILLKQYKCYTGTSDLYVFFYERGFNSLKPGGILSFISSNKYFRAAYGKKLREFLRNSVCIRQLIDFGDAPVFTAIAYPSIIIFEKSAKAGPSNIRALNWELGNPIEAFPEIFLKDGFYVPQNKLSADAWRFEPHSVLNLLEKLRKVGKPLGEYVNGRFYRGIVTGFNKAFIVDSVTKERLIDEDSSSEEVLKPFLRGRDVKRWCLAPQDLWIIFTRRGTNIKNYPAIHKHLYQYKERLTPDGKNGRKAGSYKWFEIQDNIAYWQEFEQPKIIYPNICKRNEFTWDEDNYYTNQKAFIIPGASKYLLGVLNSSVVMWLFEKLLAKLQNGYYEPSAVFMKNFPIPTTKKTKPVETIVDNILSIKNRNSDADTTLLERKIDLIVYKLYDLTYEEVRIVDPDIEKIISEKEYNAKRIDNIAKKKTGN